MVRFDLPPPPPGILEKSNEEVLEAFLSALLAAGASEKTVKAYRAAIRDFLRFIGGKRLRDVTEADVLAWISSRMRSRGRGSTSDRRSIQRTLHYYTLFLRGFFQWLGLPVKVPVVKKPRGTSVEALHPEEVARLLAAARDTLDLLIVALLFETGLRAREAVELRLRDIDMVRREIRVRNAKYGEERIVFYGPLTEAALQRWLQENPHLKPDDRLLGISYSALYKRLKSLAKRAGLDPAKVRPHVLRHTFATEALRRGMSLPAVQRLLGHRDIKVTQIYLHLLREDLRAQYNAVFGVPPAPVYLVQPIPQPLPQPPAPQPQLPASQQQPQPLVHPQPYPIAYPPMLHQLTPGFMNGQPQQAVVGVVGGAQTRSEGER